MAERLSRDKVIKRAALLVDEIGLEPLTITRLGRELGIAAPGVYRHVSGVADLRAAIGGEAAHELAGLLSAECAGLAGRAALRALALGMRDWAHEHPGQYAAPQMAPDAGDEATAVEELAAVVTAALRAYELEGDDLTDAACFVRSALHGFVLLERDGGFTMSRDAEASLERIVVALDTALGAWT